MKKIETLVLEDGFHYFCANPNEGVFASHHLREIADELDRLNAPWDKQINEYFDQAT